MADGTDYGLRREQLKARYALADAGAENVGTGGVDHLALICSDLDATIRFYTDVLGMRLTNIVANRDDETSTHIFLDMGGGNLLAFFDFPEKGPAPTVRGVGGMHHIALKGTPEQYQALVRRVQEMGLAHDIHGDASMGSIYLRDPDNIMVEVTTGYG